MLDPKEYRFIRTEILSYEELLPYKKDDRSARSHLARRYFDDQIHEYQEQGFIVEIGNMTTNVLSELRGKCVSVLFSIHLMLYMPI